MFVKTAAVLLAYLFLSGLDLGKDARSFTVSCVEMVVLE
jgi:hypothetical protein